MGLKVFIILLQCHIKKLLYVLVSGEKCLQKILVMLHYFNYKEIGIHY